MSLPGAMRMRAGRVRCGRLAGSSNMGIADLPARLPRRFRSALTMGAALVVGIGIGATVQARPSAAPAPAAHSQAAAPAAEAPALTARASAEHALWIANNLRIEDAGSYIEGLVPVKVDGRWGFLDSAGRI